MFNERLQFDICKKVIHERNELRESIETLKEKWGNGGWNDRRNSAGYFSGLKTEYMCLEKFFSEDTGHMARLSVPIGGECYLNRILAEYALEAIEQDDVEEGLDKLDMVNYIVSSREFISAHKDFLKSFHCIYHDEAWYKKSVENMLVHRTLNDSDKVCLDIYDYENLDFLKDVLVDIAKEKGISVFMKVDKGDKTEKVEIEKFDGWG